MADSPPAEPNWSSKAERTASSWAPVIPGTSSRNSDRTWWLVRTRWSMRALAGVM